MGGGTLWRSVARAVGAAAPMVTVTANAAYCSACTATPSPRSAGAGEQACNCKTQFGPAVQAHPGLTAVSYGPQQFWDTDDWEIAGHEERDHYVFGAMPTVKEVEEASSDLQNVLRLGFLTPPVPAPEAMPKPEASSSHSLRSPQSPRSPRSPTIVEVTEVTEVSTVTTVGEYTEDEVTSDLSAPQVEPEPWIEPPPYETSMISSPKEPEAPSSAMLEAFHQFQHNPQIIHIYAPFVHLF